MNNYNKTLSSYVRDIASVAAFSAVALSPGNLIARTPARQPFPQLEKPYTLPAKNNEATVKHLASRDDIAKFIHKDYRKSYSVIIKKLARSKIDHANEYKIICHNDKLEIDWNNPMHTDIVFPYSDSKTFLREFKGYGSAKGPETKKAPVVIPVGIGGKADHSDHVRSDLEESVESGYAPFNPRYRTGGSSQQYHTPTVATNLLKGKNKDKRKKRAIKRGKATGDEIEQMHKKKKDRKGGLIAAGIGAGIIAIILSNSGGNGGHQAPTHIGGGSGGGGGGSNPQIYRPAGNVKPHRAEHIGRQFRYGGKHR